MVVFYDVTTASQPPVPIRVALGWDTTNETRVPGHAFGIATRKYYPSTGGEQTMAFVADMVGRVWGFDVSYASLFGANQGTMKPQDAILPTFRYDFPLNPFDGRSDNALDIAIDGDFAYVALCRGGVDVLRIADATTHQAMLAPDSRIDTPGFAEGVEIRDDQLGNKALLVGDVLGGLRVYGL
jgi:hypothetical protein